MAVRRQLAGSQEQAAMVYSLQASIHEPGRDEALLADLDHLVSWIDAKREPVSGDEVMRVVQHRLFERLGDETTLARSQRSTRTSTGGYGRRPPRSGPSATEPPGKPRSLSAGSTPAIPSTPPGPPGPAIQGDTAERGSAVSRGGRAK